MQTPIPTQVLRFLTQPCTALTEDNEHTADFGKWTLYVFFGYNSKNIITISDSNKVLHTVNENSLFKLISLASIEDSERPSFSTLQNSHRRTS